MRKLITIMFLWVFQLSLFAQYGGANGTFDPENPANPQPVGVRYGLRVQSQSPDAGTTNVTYGEMMAGESIHLYAYPAKGFDFKQWMRDDRVLSTSQEFEFTMPEQDVVLTAVFRFNPENPGNPGANEWDGSDVLIIDDFTTGELANAIYNATNGNMDKVKTLIVSGNINDIDLGSLKAYTSVEVIDLSRCYGATVVPAFNFEHNTNLKELSLPASIKTIGQYAFYCCNNLNVVNFYATIPPTLENGAEVVFKGADAAIVYVPFESLSIYQNAEGWKDLGEGRIQPLGTKVFSLEVDLPDDYSDGRYNNMYIELASTSGQTMSYLIADKVQAYTFKNLRPDTKWTASVKNAAGQVLGTIENIEMGEENQRVEFTSLLTPQTITALVQTPNGTDVTNEVAITWLSADGAYLGKGKSIGNVLPLQGATLTLRITLPDELAVEYVKPEDYIYDVKSSDNNVTITLTPLTRIVLTGKVIDQDSGAPLSGASVIVAQTLYGRYTQNFPVTTNTQGVYTIEGAYNAPAIVTASATDYTSVSNSYESLSVVNGFASFNDIALKSLKSETNTTVTVSFSYIKSAMAGEQGEATPFEDTQNVMYTIFNQTRAMHQITEFKVVDGQIVILEELSEGDKLMLIAYSKTNAFDPLTVNNCEVSGYKAQAEFVIRQLGQIDASYVNSEATAAKAILYDGNGKFVSKEDYVDQKALFTDLPQGNYTLVSMSRSKLFNAIYDLNKFAENGLVSGVDYVTSNIYVQDGIIAPLRVAFVPYLDESKFNFMSSNTSFSVNKTLTTVGNNLTLTTLIEFKEVYAEDVSDVKLVVDLNGCEFVEGSAMAGSKVCEYTFANNQVIIPVSDLSERIRFCVKSSEAGDYAPTASVQFYYNEQQMNKPIGQVSFTIEKLGISVPELISSKTLPVSGTATARSQVWIYDDNELIGLTMALSNGSWSQNCELAEPIGNPSDHHIYAVIKSGSEETQTETKTVRYEKSESVPVLQKITMLNTAHPSTSLNLKQYETVFDFTKAQTRIAPYWYWPEYPEFTFLVYFDKPYDNLGDVELIVFTSDRKYRTITPSRYDTNRKAYIVTTRFYTEALPISVNVRKKGDNKLPSPHKPYVEYVLDPSGYVYEGVASNRLEGVTATIYYRADENSPATLWDATDYDQENPVLTDEFGMYAWDVPEGQWQIKFEKAGYETTQSEWLPVPPPQLNINIPMVQSTAPVVKKVKANNDGIEIEFDKYMLTESLTDNIFATDEGNLISGTLEWLNPEGKDESDDNQERYASRVRYKFAEPFGKTSLHLTINTNVESYAALSMANVYSEDVLVELQIKSLSAEEVVAVQGGGGEKTLTVEAVPAEAAAGKTLTVSVLSTMNADIKEGTSIVKVSEGVYTIKLDDEARAELTLKGDVPGINELNFNIEGVKAQTVVNVTEAKSLQTSKPMASRNSNQELFYGTLVNLTSETDDAKIYYTLSTDGTEPATPTVESTPYSKAITVDADEVKIKAIAKADGYTVSEVNDFTYTVKTNPIVLGLSAGWNWVSHNFANNIHVKDAFKDIEEIQEVKSQTQGVVRDPSFGLFGNLSEMSPTETYKIRASANKEINLNDYSYNVAKMAVDLSAGWNWVGYPNYQSMSPAEALTYLEASEGDQLIGKSSSAEYVNGSWIAEDGFNMNPGEGYMLKVSKATALRYNTDIVSNVKAQHHGRLNINHSPWSVDEHAYPDVMVLRAQLFHNEVLAEDEEYTVAAFCGTECRGIGKYVKGVIFMNIQGQAEDEITFLAANSKTEEIVNIEETVPFKSLNVIGSYKAPYALHLGALADGVSEQNARLGVYPAMPSTEVTVSLGGATIDHLTMTSADGKTVYASKPNTTQATINVSSLPAGIYVVAAQNGSEYFYKKIIKVNK